MVAAALPALLYIGYVYHYAVNVPFADDWTMMPVVSSALHGHLTLSLLWSQWTSSREVTGRLVFVAFGFLDHLNLRSIMLFSAGVFVATFVLVLLCVRSYSGRCLTFWPVLVLGIVWFSLADVQNALWGNQLSWYLCLFFVVAVMYLLLVLQNHARLSLGLAVLSAVLASLSFSFGFLAWPLGLICLLWLKRARVDFVIWVVAAVLMSVVYFHGWDSANVGCVVTNQPCSLTYALSRPDHFIEYYILLVGNVVPVSPTGIEMHLWVHILQGAGLLVAALLVGAQTLRERRIRANPLPLLLIAYGLLFDIMIASTRFERGPLDAVALSSSRYTMPSVLLLVAVVIYAWAHAPRVHVSSGLRLVGFATLASLLLVQSVFGISQGLFNTRNWYQFNVGLGRVIANIDRAPVGERACYESFGASGFGRSYYQVALRDHLSVFEPGADHVYRADGLLAEPQCDRQ